MKAILYADWINFRSYLRSMVCTFVLISALTVLMGKTQFFYYMTVVIGCLFPSTVFSVDHTAGWDKLSLSLPILRREVVTSRFLLTLGTQGALLASGVLFAVIYQLAGQEQDWGVTIATLLACAMVSLLAAGGYMAVAFRWGAKKASYALVGMFGLLFALLIGVANLKDVLSLPEHITRTVPLWGGTPHILPMAIGLGIVLVVYLLCYQLSVWSFQKKEL